MFSEQQWSFGDLYASLMELFQRIKTAFLAY